MPDDKPFATIPSPFVVTEEKVKQLLCDAFEGGSTYWCQIVGFKFPDGILYKDFREGERFGSKTGEAYWHPHQLIPLHEGCSLKIGDGEGQKYYSLGRHELERGLHVMAEKHPQHWANVVNDNDDAETGDVYLQCCLFGEIVYG